MGFNSGFKGLNGEMRIKLILIGKIHRKKQLGRKGVDVLKI